MSDFGVYEDEMLKKFSDQDFDRLLSGKTPESEELARLVPILRALYEQTTHPSDDRVARFASEAAELARSARPQQSAIPGRTLIRSRRFVLALRQKMATGLTAALLLSGLTGVAVASNGAAPGDMLFGVDQLLEEIGIGDGDATERIAEAQALFNAGQVAAAIAHAAQAVEVTSGGGDANIEILKSQEATDALSDAAERLAKDDTEANDAVVALLSYIADPGDDTGSEFGQNVAILARGIGGENGDAADNGADNAAAGADNSAEGLDTAEEASDDSDNGLDTADEATDNSGTDTADDATGGDRPSRP